MTFTRVACASAAIVLCLPAWGQQAPPAADPQPSRVLATVDGHPITQDELWWYMTQRSGGRLLDDLIVLRLLAREAEERGVRVSAPEVDEALAVLKAEHASEAEFERWLHETGQTLKGLRMHLQQELLIEKLLNERMGLTEEGIEQYYETHLEEFSEPPQVHLFDIVALTAEEAFAARERLAAGQAFSDVARAMSHDPTAAQGGDRGWISPDDVLREEVAEVVFAMHEGQVSDPVDCGDHFHVFYAREVRPGRQMPLAEARPLVIERIRQTRGISRELFLSLLKQRADIRVTWEEVAYLSDVYADLRAIKVVVDDRRLELPAPARMVGSHLFVPAQAVLEAMGAQVTWEPQSGVLEATREDRRVRLVAGAGFLAAGDAEIGIEEAPRIEGGVLMMPAREPVEALGGAVLWNRAENTLYVDSRPQAAGGG
ncbi:MAG: peptidyl-prolyl cis-trans isomerase [Armatimonadota bacterium]